MYKEILISFLRKGFSISIINTVRMNFHYFGLRGVFNPHILAGKKIKFLKLGGEIIHCNRKKGLITIGLSSCGIVDNKYQRVVWQNSGKIIFHGRCDISAGTHIVNSGLMNIGNRCYFNANSNIICKKQITFGDDCLISWECLIMDCDFHKIYTIENHKQVNCDKEILIGNHVWIGCRSTILKGAKLPNNSVVAACSIVTKKLYNTDCVYKSNNIIKDNVIWEH